MKKLKTILLLVATVTVVGVSIYLRYFGGPRLRASGVATTSPDGGVASGDAPRPRIGEVPRIAINGLKGDLSFAQRRLRANGALVSARLKTGSAGRTITGPALEPEASESGSTGS